MYTVLQPGTVQQSHHQMKRGVLFAGIKVCKGLPFQNRYCTLLKETSESESRCHGCFTKPLLHWKCKRLSCRTSYTLTQDATIVSTLSTMFRAQSLRVRDKQALPSNHMEDTTLGSAEKTGDSPWLLMTNARLHFFLCLNNIEHLWLDARVCWNMAGWI